MRIEDVDISKFFVFQNLGVAVSGGRDSMALLHYLDSRKQLCNYSITAINIEHGIRGAESVEDSLFVENYCRERGIAFIGSGVDAPAYADKRGLTVEQAARELRYQIFEKLIGERIVDAIALAHHLDDQCETILMRILRGTGVNGLVGMQPVRGKYIRPFLEVDRKTIDDYIKKHEIPYREDSSNDCIDYTRNYLRQEVFPKISAKFPSYKSAFGRLSRLAKEQVELLDSLASSPDYTADEARLNISDIKGAPAALAKRSIYHCMKYLGAETDFEEININDTLGLVDKANGSSVNLAGGVTAYREYNWIVFAKNSEAESIDIPFGKGLWQAASRTFEVREYSDGDLIRFDADKIPTGARIRTRREGDIFTKFGGGTKALGDYLTDKKVPKRLRDRLILIASGKEVLAIAGMEISAKIAVDDNTNQIFTIAEEKY